MSAGGASVDGCGNAGACNLDTKSCECNEGQLFPVSTDPFQNSALTVTDGTVYMP